MCKNNQDEIYIFYGIDVSNENENLFPKKICSKCYITMKHAKVKSESPKMDTSVFKAKKEMADKVTKIFQPHRRIGCKPGRKTATRTGRPCQKEQNFILKIIEGNKDNFDKLLDKLLKLTKFTGLPNVVKYTFKDF